MEQVKINWEHSSWKYLSLVGDEEVISLLHTKVYVFSDSVLSLGKVNENPQSNTAWEERLTWFKSSPEYRALDRVDGEPMEFEWNIFPGFTTLQLCHKVQEFLSKMSVEPEDFTRRNIFMPMFNDISWGDKKKRMRIKCSTRFSPCEEIWSRTVHKENGTELQRKWCWHLQKANTQYSDPRVHYPEECSKAKEVENCPYTIAPTRERLKLFFRTILAGNQLSIFGAVANVCEACDSCHDRTGRLVVEGQFNPLLVPSVMKTHIPFTDDPAQPEEDLLQRFEERVEKLS